MILYDAHVPPEGGGGAQQGFEIHGSTGAPLPEKKYWWQKKIRRKLEKKILRKKMRVLWMLILFFNMAQT